MTLSLQSFALTNKGKVRDQNEDSMWYGDKSSADQEPVALLIVCDGVGGAAGGEIASKWAVQTIRRELDDFFGPPKGARTKKLTSEEVEGQVSGRAAATRKLTETTWQERVADAIQAANAAVLGQAARHPDQAGDAGTTAVVALVRGEYAVVGNVGDSRGYLLRDGKLTQITHDHSIVASLVASGLIKPEEIYTHPQRNVIFRSLGGAESIEVDLFPLTLQEGDRLLLCSDGLWEMVRDPNIAELLGSAHSPQEACKLLIKAANDGGGEDNITAAVLFVA